MNRNQETRAEREAQGRMRIRMKLSGLQRWAHSDATLVTLEAREHEFWLSDEGFDTFDLYAKHSGMYCKLEMRIITKRLGFDVLGRDYAVEFTPIPGSEVDPDYDLVLALQDDRANLRALGERRGHIIHELLDRIKTRHICPLCDGRPGELPKEQKKIVGSAAPTLPIVHGYKCPISDYLRFEAALADAAEATSQRQVVAS
jgi:hypothetical protein